MGLRILVTGAAGFIGSNLCARLLKEGHSVICVDNFSGNYGKDYYKKNAGFLRSHKNAVFVEADISEAKTFRNLGKENITHIIHLAAKSGVRESVKFPELYIRSNVLGSMNVLNFAAEKNVNNLVMASTSSVYGNNQTPFNESMPTNRPLSPYAASKVAMEALAHSYSNIHGIPISVLRFFTVYGPRGRQDMAVYKFTKAIYGGKPVKIFGDGQIRRDFTYVGDVVEAIVSAMNTVKGFEVYNIGNGKPRKIIELVEIISKNLGKPATKEFEPEKPEDAKETYADISKAKKELGYNPKTTLEAGVKEFVGWFIGNGAK